MEANNQRLLKCQVFIGKELIIDTKLHPTFGPLTNHKIPALAIEANSNRKPKK